MLCVYEQPETAIHRLRKINWPELTTRNTIKARPVKVAKEKRQGKI
jgi:hypothetical protein